MAGRRLLSIDTLRGMDMLLIMGLSTLILRVCDLFPNGSECWLATQMYHVPWDGLAIMDMVFPTFLFIAGLSFPFSYASQVEKGRTSWQIHRKIIFRGLALVVLGIIYNGIFSFIFPQRYASVLGRIGLAWMFAALLYVHCRRTSRIVIAAVLLVGYGLLVGLVGAPDAPGGAGPLTQDGCLNGWIDRHFVPGLLYGGNYDPEGLLGVIPATVTAMLGMFACEFIRRPEEEAGGAKWTFFFRVIGLNSITIYLLQRIVPLRAVVNFFLGGVAGLLPEAWGAVLFAVGYIAVCWLLLYFLYRHKVFLKV
jgi:Uncharacterized conserved protein